MYRRAGILLLPGPPLLLAQNLTGVKIIGEPGTPDYPTLSAAADRELLGVFHPAGHGSTFGGNSLACAAAISAIRVLVREKLVTKSAATGRYFMARLKAMGSPHIVEVGGRGLLIGMVLHGEAPPSCEALAKKGVLFKETYENIIRFSPPLVVTRKEIDWACARIGEVLKEVGEILGIMVLPRRKPASAGLSSLEQRIEDRRSLTFPKRNTII